MRRIRIIVEYEGTNYVGWQTQPNGLAVQMLLEQALQVVRDCACRQGCPGCVGPVGEIGEDGKATAIALLEALTE